MSWGKSKNKAEGDIKAAGAMSSAESSQYQRSFEIGNILDQIYRGKMGVGAYPQGYQTPETQYQQQGPLEQALYGQTLSEVQDPEKYYQSTLTPQLKLAEDYINNKMQQRGLLRSGMNIENMGRAGSELAINEANAILQNRANVFSRGAGLSQTMYGQGQQNLMDLSSLYGTQQNVAQNQRDRQAQYAAYGPQAALGSYYGGQAALQALPGQLLGAAGQAAGAYFNPLSTLAKKTGGTNIVGAPRGGY